MRLSLPPQALTTTSSGDFPCWFASPLHRGLAFGFPIVSPKLESLKLVLAFSFGKFSRHPSIGRLVSSNLPFRPSLSLSSSSPRPVRPVLEDVFLEIVGLETVTMELF